MARTHVLLDDEVLAAIDAIAGKRGRSRFLEEAAREKLQRLELEAALNETAGIASEEAYPHWRTRESVAEWVSSIRRDGEDS